MKKAFTLIELLVVIAIIAILMATLLIAGSGSTERGRAAKCATNMRNLAAAAISYSVGNNGYFPRAQSSLTMKADTSMRGKGIGYSPVKGWISFLDKGTVYPAKSKGGASACSFASGDQDEILYALTNGAIWSVLGGHRESYMCPSFRDAAQNAGTLNPGWSYQMSAYFGYEPSGVTMSYGVQAFSLKRADRRLLFAEIPCIDPSTDKKSSGGKGQNGTSGGLAVNLTGGNGTAACDGCLVYKSKGGDESIGFNHRGNKRLFGHVAFADGHVEQITAPRNGNFVELTDWLCRGLDVIYKNGSYEEIKDSVTE